MLKNKRILTRNQTAVLSCMSQENWVDANFLASQTKMPKPNVNSVLTGLFARLLVERRVREGTINAWEWKLSNQTYARMK